MARGVLLYWLAVLIRQGDRIMAVRIITAVLVVAESALVLKLFAFAYETSRIVMTELR